MRIACPRCEETYRIEPRRLPAPRVRVACLACGEALFLRTVGAVSTSGGFGDDGSNGMRATASASGIVEPLAQVDDVPIWSEPRPVQPPPAERPAEETPAPSVPLEAERTAEAGADTRAPSGAAEPAVEPFAPPEPIEAARPAARAPAPSLPEVPERAAADDRDATLGGERPLEPFVRGEPAAARPLEPFLPGGAAPAQRAGGFTFSQVGDVSARAQRLARALVSDILVYHPKKVEQGLREGNLRDAMKEEVEKSWDEYCERLGPEAARSNRTPFVNALNEILARGKNVF